MDDSKDIANLISNLGKISFDQKIKYKEVIYHMHSFIVMNQVILEVIKEAFISQVYSLISFLQGRKRMQALFNSSSRSLQNQGKQDDDNAEMNVLIHHEAFFAMKQHSRNMNVERTIIYICSFIQSSITTRNCKIFQGQSN